MAEPHSDLALVTEVLAPLGRITIRPMFSGAAVYCNGVVFALHLRDALFLKADPAAVAAFETEGCGPFSYETRRGRRVITSYWQAPDRLYDEPDEFVEWARRSLAVSLAAPAKKRARSKAKPKPEQKPKP